MESRPLKTLLGILLIFGTAASGAEPNPVVTQVRSALADYHKGAEKNGRVLRVVYFHPSDVAPQDDYEARLTRIMRDIKDFYDAELKRIGFPEAGLPLEMEDENLRIHMVKGRDGADGYTHQSGQKVRREIAQALKGTMDLHNEFVLIFNGMCEKTGELSYRFYAPYYGDRRSNHREGLCHVADCEIQDPALLKDTKRRMSYNEHYGDFKQTVAGFNTKYLGGVAHELGHGLSLPHNGETRAQKSTLGTALMGSGNHTYRNEVRGKKGSFLTLASAVRLAAHPLFTGSDRGRDAKVAAKTEKLAFKEKEGKLIITGTLKAEPAVHAVISYVDPEGRSDYDALTTVALVEDGKFTLEISQPRPAKGELRLVACHANGAISRLAKTPIDEAVDKEPAARGQILDRTGRVLARNGPDGREYPLGALAAHVVGYTTQGTGRIGVEKSGDDHLGESTDLRLTLDLEKQFLAEKALRDARIGRGSVVVVDPSNGDVIAMASVPSYDPNVFVPAITRAQFDALQSDPTAPLINRSLSAYPPGSTFKCLTALTMDKPDQHYSCDGALKLSGTVFRCWNRKGHGELALSDALMHSCNCF